MPPYTFRRAGLGMTLAFALATASSVASAGAQPGPATQPVILQRVRDALDELKLTDDQRQKIDAIFDDVRGQMREMMPELQQLSPSERQQRLREVLTDLREQVVGTLTDDQKQLFEEKIEQIRRNPTGAGAGGAMERLRGAIEKLELTDDQRAKIKGLQQEIREKAQAVRAEARGDTRQIRQRLQELTAELREKLSIVLTPEQQDKLRELMREEGNARSSSPPAAPEPKPEVPKDGDKDGDAAQTMAPPGSEKLPVGHEAPGFALEKLDGRNVQLSSFSGKVLVILFGNFTSPSFRQRAEDFEQVHREYGRRAEFLIIYTRESHATGEWEVARNRDAGISVEQPTDLAGRIALAKRARQTLGITIPIAIDSIDDKTAKDYDGFTTATVIIGRDGVVMARQNWFDAATLRKQLDEIVPAR